jgi:hypothetical protein
MQDSIVAFGTVALIIAVVVIHRIRINKRRPPRR